MIGRQLRSRRPMSTIDRIVRIAVGCTHEGARHQSVTFGNDDDWFCITAS